MITDIGTVLWKEIKELIFQRGRFRGGLTGILLIVVVFGIFLPLQSGRNWIDSPVGLLAWCWVPFLMVSNVVADAFAGERERHTLETLLASRLSDRAIMLGKLAASITYGWGITLGSVLLGLITVNIAYGHGQLLLYPWKTALGTVILSFLVAALAAGLGILVSLRAATVRQAQQTFSLAFFVLSIPLFLLPLLPDNTKLRLTQVLLNTNLETVAIAAIGLLLFIDCILVALASARFKRDKLILD